MIIHFSKYHGAGNDFIILDGSFYDFLTERHIAQLCDRHKGIGADGMIFLSPQSDGQVRMRYYNSDGRESTMCGNGGRCAVAYVHKQALCEGDVVILAIDGPHPGRVLSASGNEWQIIIQMGDAALPVNSGQGFFIDTGSPHHIQFVEEIESYDVRQHGASIRYSLAYAPQGTNVDFVQEKEGALFVRTYERGVEDETLACGTGVTAVALSLAYLKGEEGEQQVKVIMPGGALKVHFNYRGAAFSNVWLEGPAVHVFDGTTEILEG